MTENNRKNIIRRFFSWINEIMWDLVFGGKG